MHKLLNRLFIFCFICLGIDSTVCCAMSSPSSILSGKRVLVTGAGRGIGQAIAVICSRAGAQVAVTSRTESELQETVRLARGNPLSSTSECSADNMSIHVADVTNYDQVEMMVKSIVDKWGGLDVLINNSGGAQNPKGLVDTLESAALSQLLQLNVVGTHIVTSAVLRLAMKDSENGGSRKIINISSKAAKVGIQNYSFYVASKFALEGMTSSWSKELAEKNIQVNSISPGMVNTKSFPKPKDKKGVRTAESIEDGLMVLLNSSKTGHYLHVDELDQVRAAGLPDETAMKPIDEPSFNPT